MDRKWIGILGGSCGGWMVMASMASSPDMIAAGIDIFGATKRERTLKRFPRWRESLEEALYGEMGDPATGSERHRDISPLFHATNISRPVLVARDVSDPRVLVVESDEKAS